MEEILLGKQQQRANTTALARLAAILEPLNPIDLSSPDKQLSKLDFASYVNRQDYREHFAQLKIFQQEIREEVLQTAMTNMQASTNDESDDGTAPSNRAVRDQGLAPTAGRSLLDDQSVHIILTMIEAMLYLNEEALSLFQGRTLGSSSQECSPSIAQQESRSTATTGLPGRRDSPEHEAQVQRLNGVITALTIQLKKGELSLKEKAGQIAELQQANQALALQLHALEFQDMQRADEGELQSTTLTRGRALTLGERIQVRKSEVKGAQQHLQDQEIRSLQSQMDQLQQKIITLEDDKLMAEMKIQEQEVHIQEQFEIIQDYSNEIEDHNIRGQLQDQRIRELEEQLQQVIDTKCKDSFAFIEKAKNDETNATVGSPEHEDASYKMNQSEFTVNSGPDRNVNKLKEDMDQLNEQFHALGLLKLDQEDSDLAQNAKNIYEIMSRGSGGSQKSYLSNRNKYCFNNVTTGLQSTQVLKKRITCASGGKQKEGGQPVPRSSSKPLGLRRSNNNNSRNTGKLVASLSEEDLRANATTPSAAQLAKMKQKLKLDLEALSAQSGEQNVIQYTHRIEMSRIESQCGEEDESYRRSLVQLDHQHPTLNDPDHGDLARPEDSRRLAGGYKTTPPELFSRSPLGPRSFVNRTEAAENPQDEAGANTDSFQLRSTIVEGKQQIDNHNLFCNSFASVKPVTVQEAGQSMVTVEETEEPAEKKPKEAELLGLITKPKDCSIKDPKQAIGAKPNPLKKGTPALNLGLNLGGKPGTTLEQKPPLQLKLALSPGLKLTGLQSNKVLLNKQLKCEETQKMYEENLTNILKSYHKDYLKQNQIAIHKMIISENVVQINTAGDAKEQKELPKDTRATVKFDLRMACQEAERDYFKICAISQIFNQPQFFMDKLKAKSPQEMYARAKNPALNNGQDIQFYQFSEWIQKDLANTLYGRDQNTSLQRLKLSHISFANRSGGDSSLNISSQKNGSVGGLLAERRATNVNAGLTGLRPPPKDLKLGLTAGKVKLMLGKGLKLNDVSQNRVQMNEQNILNLKKQIQDGTAKTRQNVGTRLGLGLKQAPTSDR